MPSMEQSKEMAADLKDKEAELAASKFTEDALQAELARRRAEFDKVSRIDADVNAETESLQSRIRVMRAEMHVFADIDRVRSTADATAEELERQREAYKARRDGSHLQLRALAAEYQRKKALLDSHEVEADLRRLEEKLRTKEATVQASRECEWGVCPAVCAVMACVVADVAEKGRHTEYRELKSRVLELTAELNERLREAVTRVVPVAAGLA
jgi:hypothetical protein